VVCHPPRNGSFVVITHRRRSGYEGRVILDGRPVCVHDDLRGRPETSPAGGEGVRHDPVRRSRTVGTFSATDSIEECFALLETVVFVEVAGLLYYYLRRSRNTRDPSVMLVPADRIAGVALVTLIPTSDRPAIGERERHRAGDR